MGLYFYKQVGFNKVLQPNKINISLPFGSSSNGVIGLDTFQSTSVKKYMTEESISYAIQTNPRIKEILEEMKIPQKLNMAELQKLANGHAQATQDIASGIILNIPSEIKSHINIKSVKEAALLHDIGKVLIPENILNKNTSLNSKEKEIMHRHSELGYEILKNTDVDTRTLELVKYHHQNQNRSGYPVVNYDFFADINLQILNTADKYSALIEKRPYKEEYDKDKALGIIYKEVKNGNLHPIIYKALYNYVNNCTVNNPFI